MSVGATLYFLIKIFVLPPGLLVALGVAGMACYPRHRRLGRGLLIAAPLLTWLLSMPLFAAWAARPFESDAPLTTHTLTTTHADAIVVLGGGAYRNAPEYGGADNVRALTLERLRYAAHLQRLTHLPLVVSGGYAPQMATSEAQLMRRALQEDFGVPVAGIEDGSLNTAQNARLSRAAFPYQTILLVTHAMHMQRAKQQFERAGFSVVAAPLGFLSERSLDYVLSDFMPTLQGLMDSHYVIYEAAGALWYRYAYD
jgi:uncharacterized SAM-binding protein YcdF (DUF218 family)